MATTNKPITVLARETLLERYVTRKFLGLFRYDVVINRSSVGYRLFVDAEELPTDVIINGIKFAPLTDDK